MTKAEEQAKALIDADISCVIAYGSELTLREFKGWIDGSIEDYHSDEYWQQDVKAFNLDMNFIKANAQVVYGYIFVNMK